METINVYLTYPTITDRVIPHGKMPKGSFHQLINQLMEHGLGKICRLKTVGGINGVLIQMIELDEEQELLMDNINLELEIYDI